VLAVFAAIAADGVLVLHLAFIVFVLVGGLLVLRWRRLALLHAPAVAWAAFVELSGVICPLTLIENRLRAAAGLSGYAGDFVGHYLLRVIYPAGLSRATQLLLALVVIVVNVAIYATMLRSLRSAEPLREAPR
jgi:hypothetical protein